MAFSSLTTVSLQEKPWGEVLLGAIARDDVKAAKQALEMADIDLTATVVESNEEDRETDDWWAEYGGGKFTYDQLDRKFRGLELCDGDNAQEIAYRNKKNATNGLLAAAVKHRLKPVEIMFASIHRSHKFHVRYHDGTNGTLIGTL